MDMRLGSLNLVLLMGHVTAEPDLRYTPSGAAVLGFRVGVNRRWKDKATDEWREEASFFSVNQWGAGGERNAKLLHKGTPVLVEGSLRSRTWEDKKDGAKRYAVEVFAQRVQCLEKQAKAEGAEPGAGEPEPPDDIPAF